MNIYSKYMPNVFLAKCTERHEKGEIIPVTTKYGRENDSIIFNLIYEKDGFYYYSIIRADGFNIQERAKAKSEKYNTWAAGAENKSNEFYEKSQKAVDGIVFGQPILVGHHSEKRHRKAIDRSWNAVGKSVEMSDKAAGYNGKADYWQRKSEDVNLSMPESVEYFAEKLVKAKEYHEGLKSGKYVRSHSYSLTYAKKEVNDFENKYQIAKRLWE